MLVRILLKARLLSFYITVFSLLNILHLRYLIIEFGRFP